MREYFRLIFERGDPHAFVFEAFKEPAVLDLLGVLEREFEDLD